MDCHCKDHLPGEWHSHEDCDCRNHEHPTYSFVVTKVLDKDPGMPVVFISKVFMETLGLNEGDPVEIVGPKTFVLQARSHPNSWIDTRMVSLDPQTMEAMGCALFSQLKIRKIECNESERLVLEVPVSVGLSKIRLRGLIERMHGTILFDRDNLQLLTERNESINLRVVDCRPCGPSRLGRITKVEFVTESGEEYASKNDVTFHDVGGLEEAIRKVKEVVRLPLKHPEIFERLGIDPPGGVLLYGPSGTGKTLIAKATASETGCFFKSISGTEIMDKYYGESEAKLRAAFEDAYQNAPAIIFIDEIDALAPRRDTAEGDVEKRVTAQLLALMDGMSDRGRVMVLAATNLPNALDTALRRPGRFDREILVGVPDRAGRRDIFAIHTRDMPMGKVDLDSLAERTHGFVGADIKALCQEAGLMALRRILPGLEDTDDRLSEDFLDAIQVETSDFEEALKDMRPASGRSHEIDLGSAGWDRIAGYTKEIEFLKDTVLWPMINSTFLERIEVGRPPGLLITGPSGTGKTLMARSLGKAGGFNVMEIRGPELPSKYVGESERNIRELFGQARQMAPTVLIMDGLDVITTTHSSDSGVGDRIVNQIAQEMNAISNDRPVLVIGIAARKEGIPLQLRSAGRFVTELRLRLPDKSDREAMFRMYLQRPNTRFAGSYELISDQSEGMTPRDIEEICRRALFQAARRAVENNQDGIEVRDEDVLKALDLRRLSG